MSAVSGFEYLSNDGLFSLMKEMGFVPQIDKYGNVYAQKFAESSDFSLLIDAHRDEIGLIVSEICDGGFLKFSTVGGIDKSNLFSTEVTVYGKEPVYGIIGAVPPHLKSTDKETMYIDTGLKNIGDIVKIGDPVKFKTKFLRLHYG